VEILDAEALYLSFEYVADYVKTKNPRFVGMIVYGHQPNASTQQMAPASETCKAIKAVCDIPIVIAGGHVSALPEKTLQEEAVDYVAVGEGVVTIDGLLNGDPHTLIPGLVWRGGRADGYPFVNIFSSPPPPLTSLDELHGDAWDLLPMDRYRAHDWQCLDGSPRQPYASIYTSLGCPYKCLSGDTPINTIYGNIPIKELAEQYGDQGVPVYAYDPEKLDAFIADSVYIRKYGSDRLVRVHFDDGTHIDCTPDHQFLQFKVGGGKPMEQWGCEAQHLNPGDRLRALRYDEVPAGYVTVRWGRRSRRIRSRMVMDYLKGRKLKRTEHVHHIDHNKSNDHPDNLQYCSSAKDHARNHPEIAERMRTNNPTRNGVTKEWAEKTAAANRGKKRSMESRMRYRASKLGKNNPNYKHGKRLGTGSRIPDVNHRVVSVEWLSGTHDVYCLTVPETGWFFANDVLVKNCSFCCINSPFGGSGYRTRSPEDVVAEVRQLHDIYGVKTFKIIDEMFVLKPTHYIPICEAISKLPYANELNFWAYARVDTVKPENLAILRAAGVRWLALGIESGSAHVRDGAEKSLDDGDIRAVVKAIQDADINVIGNFIFGLPDDTRQSMRETLELAISLDCDFANFYSAMAYPGSKLFTMVNPDDLPPTWSAYSQHSFDCKPLPTDTLTSAEVLRFRDEAHFQYFTSPQYLAHIRRKFGNEAVDHCFVNVSSKLPRAVNG